MLEYALPSLGRGSQSPRLSHRCTASPLRTHINVLSSVYFNLDPFGAWGASVSNGSHLSRSQILIDMSKACGPDGIGAWRPKTDPRNFAAVALDSRQYLRR